MSQDNVNTLLQQHKALHLAWLQQPVTKSAIKMLYKLREEHVNDLSAKSNNHTIDDGYFRAGALSIRCIDAIVEGLTNSEKFAEKTTINK